jgi:predicted nucleotidyltransferase
MTGVSAAETLDDPVLREVRARLKGVYGDRIKRVVLYGSRARGDHRPDSDYDIAVFLRGEVSREDRDRLSDLSYDLLMENNWDVSIYAFKLSVWRIQTFFMYNVRREGVEF